MTSALLLDRDCIIYSVNVWLVPVECAFNMIESEFVRRGVIGGDKRRHLDVHLKSRRKQHMPFTSGRTANERSRIAPKGLQRGSRAP